MSYSQNQEDVLLDSALHDVPFGFYVDVGAAHPVTDSVTKYFYDLGWNGINIEPVRESFNDMVTSRPRDINLNYAIGAKNQTTKIYKSMVPGRHSLNSDYAAHLGKSKEEQLIEQKTLTSALDENVLPNQIIHFLKIDVEGYEKEVLDGLDLLKYRPWIIVVESLNPVTLEDESKYWEVALLKSNYIFAHFDGLNKYYLEREQSHRERYLVRVNVLLSNFSYPNKHSLVDEVKSNESRIKELQDEVKSNESRIKELQDEVRVHQHRHFELAQNQMNYDLILKSKTFRYTHSLRVLYSRILFYASRGNSLNIKLVALSQFLKRFPRVRGFAINSYFMLIPFIKHLYFLIQRKTKHGAITNSAINLANSKSMERSFQLKPKKS
jgi:FkbM family methyltransferase